MTDVKAIPLRLARLAIDIDEAVAHLDERALDADVQYLEPVLLHLTRNLAARSADLRGVQA